MNLIDIRLVGTQILGFLLLLWALRAWVWGPVLKGLEQRKQAIAGRFADADRAQAAADALKAQYEQKLKGADAEARTRIQQAMAEGQKLAGEVKAQAQAESQQRLERAADEIAREREKAKEGFKLQVVSLSIRAAEKILRQKLDSESQRKLVGEFVDEVGAL
jgi:F-type H+-transporting ATPase subunit b